MLSADLLRQVRRLHLKARRVVQSRLGGEYHSAFKGAGLLFDEVREYQPGDDVRRIDWNVTARAGRPFVKRYVEERELTVLLAVDASGSLRFGTQAGTKRAVAAELAALVALAAAANNDRVGLLLFSDHAERYVPPDRGPRHLLRVLRDALFYQPERPGTDLAAALDHLAAAHRRRAVVFLFSDFLADGFDRPFRRLARRHDLIAVRVGDPREADWPAVGLVQFEDAETGRAALVDASDPRFRSAFAARAAERRAGFAALARRSGVDLIDAGTDGTHVDALVRFFKARERRRGRP